MYKPLLTVLFWIVLIAFFSWDWAASAGVNTRTKPPIIAIASGQPPSGAHCASTF